LFSIHILLWTTLFFCYETFSPACTITKNLTSYSSYQDIPFFNSPTATKQGASMDKKEDKKTHQPPAPSQKISLPIPHIKIYLSSILLQQQSKVLQWIKKKTKRPINQRCPDNLMQEEEQQPLLSCKMLCI
jgi:hypothetical protein